MLFQQKIKTIALVLFLIVLQVSCCFGQQFFKPQTPIYFETQYSDPAFSGLGSTVQWMVKPKTYGDAYTLEFFPNGGKQFCSVKFNLSQPNIYFELKDSKGNLIDHSTGSFIPTSGFPAPCRVIDFSALNFDGGFKIMRTAGNRKFSKEYQVRTESVSVVEALENQWLDATLFEKLDDPDLNLFIIETMDNKFLFKQLWQKDDTVTWWLYEETLINKSWRKRY